MKHSRSIAAKTHDFLCLVFILFLWLPAPVALAEDVPVHSAEELQSAVGRAKPGAVIRIGNGSYTNWSCELSGRGTAEKPIIIKPESAGRVIFTGTTEKSILTLSGKCMEVSGMVFTRCTLVKASLPAPMLVEIKGDNCRLTGCIFISNEAKTQFMPIVAVTAGQYNRIDHCQFTGNINNMDIQVRVTEEPAALYTLIEHNEFKDKARVSWPVFNGGECVQIGQDPVLLGTKSAYVTVRDNHFIRCKAEAEVISNKSSDNRYIHNTLEDCDGEIVMRGGHRCLIDSNVIKGGLSGIRVNGSSHLISNNSISGTQTGIRLMYGMAKGTAAIGFYIAATNCEVIHNRISQVKTGIVVGDGKNQDWTGKFNVKRYPSRTLQDIAPEQNRIADNQITATDVPIKEESAN
jgi:poly(beta-D-mannuronate) lyase